MKYLKSLSLRWRLTLFMAFVLTITSVTFLSATISTAKDVYHPPVIDGFMITHNGELLTVKKNETTIATEREGRVYKQLTKAEMTIKNQDERFSRKNISIATILIILGAVATYFMAGRALKPVSELSERVLRIDEGQLSNRLLVPQSKDEVAQLAASFNKMLAKMEKAFENQKNFSANVAHELKTPLAGMISSIEVLMMDENPSIVDCKGTLRDCLNNAERLNLLVNDLLEIRSQGTIQNTETFELSTMLDAIIEDLTKEIKSQGIEIVRKDQHMSLIGDKNLLSRVFYNLIHNAIKYNKEQGKITVYTCENEDEWCISIQDTGIGISNEEHSKIFENFYCVDKSRSRELGGSGLGLSIVKMIVEKHRGNIIIDSAIGEGTTFTVKLPK